MGIEQTSSERSQLTQLLNTKTLLGHVVSDTPELGNSSPIAFALGANVSAQINGAVAALRPAGQSNLRLDPQLSVSQEQHPLDAAFEVLCKDVRSSRDRLLALNPGRRTAIERRLEFIARKVARTRGEKLNRSLSLTDILRDSYREVDPGRTLGLSAWEGFVAEVALFQLLEIFFLKQLDRIGWRTFEDADLGRLNFAIHSFLQNNAQGFSYDKHCWNFVRSNVYSWYVPSSAAAQQLAAALNSVSEKQSSYPWDDLVARQWLSSASFKQQFRHLDFAGEAKAAGFCSEVFERLGVDYLSKFHGETLCKKTFLPCLELGAFPLALVEKLLSKIGGECEDICADSSQLSRAIWACESELFEVSFTEMMGLLCLLRHLKHCTPSRTRLPQILHIAPLLGLELHNLEQLPLGGPDVSRLHQGTAGQIQQIEAFDQALVLDQIDRAKSTRWLKALAEQLPHWRGLLTSSSNLNWGELHLNVAISKLKEQGLCVYLSHRVLPDSHDGERLRKALLGMATLEYFVELTDDQLAPFRYLYVFKREHSKHERDNHRPRFGKFSSSEVDFSDLEDSNASQLELAERGWDHLFVRGAAPLVRHLNQKFPKLFQMASIQTWSQESSNGLFASPSIKGNAIEVLRKDDTLSFAPLSRNPEPGKTLIFPHNPSDAAWLVALLNSSPVQFWLRHQLFVQGQGKAPRLQELKSAPMPDLSGVPAHLVHEALEWLGQQKPNAKRLNDWALGKHLPLQTSEDWLSDAQARFIAMAKKAHTLRRAAERYRPLFNPLATKECFALYPEAVTQFYPSTLLARLRDCPEIRVHFADRAKTPLSPDHWILSDVSSVGQGELAFVLIAARQGPIIQITVPYAIKDYVVAQAKALKDHLWSEALQLLRIPRDISLFTAQTTEIVRVIGELDSEVAIYESSMNSLAQDLFEVAPEMREFLEPRCQIL